MAEWAIPQYSRADVDRAGRILASRRPNPQDWEIALTIISNWRSSHSFPLNTMQNHLRRKAKEIDAQSLIAQRIKRLPAIRQKLMRFKSWLTLSEMQDIGGCRAVVRDVRHVQKLLSAYRKSDIKHKLEDIDDYIANPKRSGYRGVHLIYRYHSDRKETYEGLKIEIQLRSPAQHAWATAVEIVGLFIKQPLKSSLGRREWLRFFALMGSAIAAREGCAGIPDTPATKKELRAELREYGEQLDVENDLQIYGAALQNLEEVNVAGGHYFLLELNPVARSVKVTGYKPQEFERASQDYLVAERAITEHAGLDAVLVSAESLTALRRAYPNYFLDLHAFIKLVSTELRGKGRPAKSSLAGQVAAAESSPVQARLFK